MPDILGGSYSRNSVDTRSEGVDVVASHAFLFSDSRVLRMLAGYSHTRTVITHVAPAPPQLALLQSQLFSRTSRGVIENTQPRETITLTLDYRAGPFQLNLGNERSGPTAQLDLTNPAADLIERAKWITDARISYQLRPRVQLAISAANLLDVYPDEWPDFKDGALAVGSSMHGINRYPGLSPLGGQNGRTLYLRMTYH